MTIREHLKGILGAYGLEDSHLESVRLPLDEVYALDIEEEVGKASVALMADLLFAPRRNNISEGGFSVSFDFSNASKHYLYLCDKWKVEPNPMALSVSGLSVISDKTNCW